MRRFTFAAVLTASLSAASSAAAQDRGFVQGFGGLQLDTFGGTTAGSNTSFGGVVGASLTPNIQVVGEGGRIGNVVPSGTNALLAFSPIGFGVSAWYGQGGVRFTGSSLAIRPYAEAAAGIARLSSNLGGLDGRGGVLADLALRFLDRTEPIATVGGGVTIGGGAFVADLGYRYRRVFSSSWMDVLGLGDSLHSNEVRLGLGVRF
jgi:opacity protein-like surface antigen